MGKIAFLFAGQGAQQVNMGKDLYDSMEEIKEFYWKMGQASGLDFEQLIFTENENLNITEYTQPAILTTSLAIALEAAKIVQPDVVAGLSLGEYSALTFAGCLHPEVAVELVRTRGKLMSEAVPAGVGKLCAILGLSREQVEETLDKLPDVTVANYNCPGQYVIGGTVKAVDIAKEKLSEIGAKRAVDLAVSVPSHTPLMKDAAEPLRTKLETLTFEKANYPVYMNVAGSDVYESMLDMLVLQVTSPVRFEDIVQKMVQDGVDTFVEIGPGKVLSGFVKKVDRSLKIFSVEDLESLSKLKTELGG